MWKALLGLLGLALALAAAMLGPALVGENFRAVVRDRVYRSGQLSPEELEERIRRHRLKSIVNLRGEKDDRDWFLREVEVAKRHRVALESVDLIPERLPSRPDLVRLIDHLEGLSEPILIHCSAGADRAGFASVLARMAKGGSSFDEARSELSLWYGHLPVGPASEIGRIFDQYDEYRRTYPSALDGSDWESFERWAREVYVPYVYSAAIEAAGLPAETASGERMEVRVRARNESPGPWVLTEDQARGVKLGVKLLDAATASWIDYDRHGHRDQTVAPGETLMLDVAIWAPRTPGEYELKLDMVDEHVTWFEDQGSRPFSRKLTVRPAK
jgi:protein tyrosine/serine phosphatase